MAAWEGASQDKGLDIHLSLAEATSVTAPPRRWCSRRCSSPGDSAYAGILLSFGTQFVGFAARPIGAMIFGHYGDRIGRKATLISTLLLMGIATFLMGLLPSYAAIGAAAPILMVVLRVAQGIGVGGEWGGSVLLSHGMGQAAPARLHGQLAPGGGAGRAAAVHRHVQAVQQRGRVLVRQLGLAGAVPGQHHPGRRRAVREAARPGEPLVQTSSSSQNAIVRRPVWQVIKEQPREILCSAFVRMSEQAPFYIFITFVLTYGTDHLGLSKDSLLNATLVAAAVSLVSVPFFGYLSDLIGRRLMYGIGIVCVGLYAFPYFGLLNTKVAGLVLLAIVLSLFFHDMQYGPQAALIAEILRAERPVQRRRARIPARLGDRRRPRAAHRGGDPELDRLQHLYQLVPGRLRGDLHDRAAAHAAPRRCRPRPRGSTRQPSLSPSRGPRAREPPAAELGQPAPPTPRPRPRATPLIQAHDPRPGHAGSAPAGPTAGRDG